MITIFKYRYYQYLGCYVGNHLHRNTSRRLKDSYFYPTDSKGLPCQLTIHYEQLSQISRIVALLPMKAGSRAKGKNFRDLCANHSFDGFDTLLNTESIDQIIISQILAENGLFESDRVTTQIVNQLFAVTVFQ